VPNPERNDQRGGFRDHHHDQQLEREVGIENVADRIVTDTKHSGHKESNDTEAQCANCRPPELVNGKLLEKVFGPVEKARKADGCQPADHA
jgi:hypothetical protein